MKAPKLFWTDCGLAASLAGIRSRADLANRLDAGFCLEQTLFQTLQTWSALDPVHRRIHFWRARSGHEVDFVLEHDGKLVALEIKAGSQVTGSDAASIRALRETMKRKPTLVRGVVLHAAKTRPLDPDLVALPWGWMAPTLLISRWAPFPGRIVEGAEGSLSGAHILLDELEPPIGVPTTIDSTSDAPSDVVVKPPEVVGRDVIGPSPEMVRFREEAVVWFKTLASAAIYATLIVTFVGQVARVEGQSMVPTLEDQDRLVVNKLAYFLGDPQVGDIVMLYYPEDPTKSFVKRVVAAEDDTIRSVDGRVYRNDVPFPDDFIPEEYRSKDSWGPIVVRRGYYYVMGDHRNNSSDSRTWGEVPKKYITGKVQVRWWPMNHVRLF